MLYLGNRSCCGHPEWDLMPGEISLKDIVLRAVYPGSDHHTRDVQNMIFEKDLNLCSRHDLYSR